MTANPTATLNRAIALTMVHGPAAGLAALAGLDTLPATTGSTWYGRSCWRWPETTLVYHGSVLMVNAIGVRRYGHPALSTPTSYRQSSATAGRGRASGRHANPPLVTVL